MKRIGAISGTLLILIALTGCAASPQPSSDNTTTASQSTTNATSTSPTGGTRASQNGVSTTPQGTLSNQVGNTASASGGTGPAATTVTPATVTPTFRWSSAPTLTAVQFVTSAVGFVGGKGMVIRTSDGGKSWYLAYSAPGTVRGIDFLNETTGFVTCNDCVLKTTDGGRNWRRFPGAFEKICMVDANNGFALQNGRVEAVTVNSADLKATPVSLPINVEDISFIRETIGYASGDGMVYKTVDGGAHWTKIFAATFAEQSGPWYTRILASSGTDVWCMVFGGASGMNQVGYVLYHTNNGGATWTPLLDEGYFTSAYGGVHPTSSLGVGAQPGPFTAAGPYACFVGWNVDDLVLTTTHDGGRTFTRYDAGSTDIAGMPDFFSGMSVSFADPKSGWIVGSKNGHGIALYTHDGGVTWHTVN